MDKKKVLFIAPTFFGYYKEIIKELEASNYEVDYFCDSPSNTSFSKALGRINKNFIKILTKRYFYNEVIPKIEEKNYDYIFVIVGMTFSFFPDMIEKIKILNKDSKFILYQWDGEKNISFVKKIHCYFDKLYTFDREDLKNNDKYKFLPLFYTRGYEEVGKKKHENYEYDLSYIGTAHPKKLQLINEMAEKTKKFCSKQYIYHYMPSKFKYIYHKLTAKEYRNIKLRDLKLEKLPTEKLMEIFEKSKCILDSPQEGQTGLTIRTIECLGAKRKLITTNQDIKNYDFYNNNNILIFDGEVNNYKEFFKKEYVDIPNQIYEKYSLRSWLETIFQD